MDKSLHYSVGFSIIQAQISIIYAIIFILSKHAKCVHAIMTEVLKRIFEYWMRALQLTNRNEDKFNVSVFIIFIVLYLPASNCRQPLSIIMK